MSNLRGDFKNLWDLSIHNKRLTDEIRHQFSIDYVPPMPQMPKLEDTKETTSNKGNKYINKKRKKRILWNNNNKFDGNIVPNKKQKLSKNEVILIDMDRKDKLYNIELRNNNIIMELKQDNIKLRNDTANLANQNRILRKKLKLMEEYKIKKDKENDALKLKINRIKGIQSKLHDIVSYSDAFHDDRSTDMDMDDTSDNAIDIDAMDGILDELKHKVSGKYAFVGDINKIQNNVTDMHYEPKILTNNVNSNIHDTNVECSDSSDGGSIDENEGWVVRKILNDKKKNNIKYYKVDWAPTWTPKSQLQCADLIREYKKTKKGKKAKKTSKPKKKVKSQQSIKKPQK